MGVSILFLLVFVFVSANTSFMLSLVGFLNIRIKIGKLKTTYWADPCNDKTSKPWSFRWGNVILAGFFVRERWPPRFSWRACPDVLQFLEQRRSKKKNVWGGPWIRAVSFWKKAKTFSLKSPLVRDWWCMFIMLWEDICLGCLGMGRPFMHGI